MEPRSFHAAKKRPSKHLLPRRRFNQKLLCFTVLGKPWSRWLGNFFRHASSPHTKALSSAFFFRPFHILSSLSSRRTSSGVQEGTISSSVVCGAPVVSDTTAPVRPPSWTPPRTRRQHHEHGDTTTGISMGTAITTTTVTTIKEMSPLTL